MTRLLDAIGPAIWCASWQAAALVLLVMLLVWCFGERLSPRWRFLLWSVVLARLLIVATPASPWSIFNLVRWNVEASEPTFAQRGANADFTSAPPESASTSVPHQNAESPQVASSVPELSPARAGGVKVKSPPPSPTTTELPARGPGLFERVSMTRILLTVWMAGCLLLFLRLLASAIILRRSLSACRRVTDASLLQLLETSCRAAGLRRTPVLLVTPACLSPCIVGTWNPRIVLQESVITQSLTARLRHVLAHEVAHLVRGDLWTNWLLLTARVLHWFNPVAWWTVSQMQAEREAACDDLAFAALGETDRSGYAATIVDLVLSLTPSPLAPELVGLSSSAARLRARIERFLRSASARTLRAPIPVVLLISMALLGLTDALPGVQAQPPKAAVAKRKAAPDPHTVSGRCVNDADRSPLARVSVRLYRLEGRVSPPVEIARTLTDANGRYAFTGLVPPRPESHVDRLNYGVFAFVDHAPVGIGFSHFADNKEVVELRMTRDKLTLSGKVIDAEGQPIAGATVLPYFIYDRPVPSLFSATTDAGGRFRLDNLGVYKWPDGKAVATSCLVRHPEHPETFVTAALLPADVVVTMPAGCIVTGTVVDKIAGEPAEGATVTARRTDEWHESFAATDAAGHFRLVVPEGRYDFLADAADRVCIAVTGQECLLGEQVELPEFALIGGGFIAGQVINTVTGKLVSTSEGGEPIMLGLLGPSQPAGTVIAPARLAAVDKTRRFVLRAAPGENFPYFVNTRGVRMAWDTRNQPPVIVKEGETTEYDMLITPPIPPEEKLKAAHKVVAALPKKPLDRTTQILRELRKLNHTVDETELCCLLMRELVSVGQEAAPQLCAELDRTTEDRMLRRLGFALRAIGDPRAVPALIWAIPKTLLPSSSDYGLIVDDKELANFMQTHDLRAGKGGQYFDLGRPVREIFGALHVLTQRDPHDSELFGIHLSEDPRRQVLQRRLYVQHSLRWQAWWEANWKTFTEDAAYRKVNLNVSDEPLPPASDPQALPETTRLSGEMTDAVLSPAIEQGQYAWHFYDLDTGFRPDWPASIRRDEASLDTKELRDWVFQMGVDLMCVTHRSPDGTETYVLRAPGMNVWEITPRDLRNLDKLLAGGRLPEGRPVDELLMHYDAGSQQLVPDANGIFLFITGDGNMGVIETTDRVTRVADLTGMPSGPPPGVGFHKGVRFNLSAIVP